MFSRFWITGFLLTVLFFASNEGENDPSMFLGPPTNSQNSIGCHGIACVFVIEALLEWWLVTEKTVMPQVFLLELLSVQERCWLKEEKCVFLKEPQISVVFAHVNTNPMGKKITILPVLATKCLLALIKWLKYVLKVIIRKISVKISTSETNQLIY